MSNRERFSRKSLKKPDEFISTSGRLISYFGKNRGKVTIIAVMVAVVFLAVFGVRYNKQAQEANMEALLFEMGQILKQENDKKSDQALKDLEPYLAKFKEGPQKQRAGLMIADVYFQKNQLDNAIKLYSEIISRTSVGEMSYDLAQLGLASSFEGKKEFKKAIDGYKAIIERKTFSLPLFNVYLSLSRCYELDNDKKNALLVLREMISKFQSVKDLDKINQQINKLESKT